MKRRKAREYALQILYQYDMTKVPPEKEGFSIFWNERPVQNDVKSFSEELVIGTIKNLEHIDSLIKTVVNNWKMERMSAIDRNILRLASYELLFEDEIPAAVTLNEAIEIAKKYSTGESSLFINGVLDKLAKKLKKRIH